MAANPTCSLSQTATTFSDLGGIIVQNRSTLIELIEGTAYDGATIKNFIVSVAVDGTRVDAHIRYPDDDYPYSYIAYSGTVTTSAYAVDSNGRVSDAVSESITVVPYENPKITTLTAERCTSDGTADPAGTYMKITYEASVSSLDGNNTNVSFRIGYKKQSDTSYTYTTVSSSSYAASGSVVVSADESSVYDVIFEARDYFNNSTPITAKVTVPAAFSLLHFNSTGRGMGIGAINEEENLRIGLDTIINNPLTVHGYSRFRGALDSDTFFGNYGGLRFYSGLITGAGGEAKWIRLGAISGSWDACNHVFRINSGNGFNGEATQNTTIEIVVKDGWQSTHQIANAFGSRAIIYSYNDDVASNFDYYVVATAYNAFELWLYLPWEYWNGDYTVATPATWTHIATLHDAVGYSTSDQMQQDSVAFMNVDYGNFNDAFAVWALNLVYPVGSIYMSYNNTSPASFLGGTWTSISADRVLRTTTDSSGATGGEATHTLTVSEIPSHTHAMRYNQSSSIGTVSYPHLTGSYGTSGRDTDIPLATIVNTGGGGAHNNWPPYITVFAWRRTA